MNTSLESKISILKDRAALLGKARVFFSERGVLEVDCPALSHASPIDLHIDVMTVSVNESETGYLHTSPEYGMKRLLALGISDIYQISHVYRAAEFGPLHNPEFTMAEWYRIGMTFPELMEETLAFIRLFLGEMSSSYLRYRDALIHYAGIDYVDASCSELLACAEKHKLGLPKDADTWDKDTLLQLLVSFLVEPHLGKDRLDVLYDFPATQAALARTKDLEKEQVAMRFEVYFRGIELANGYHELTDPVEQRKRLEQSVQARIAAGKDPLKIDEHFLNALETGIPDCCGVAVGFDRLMLLRHNKENLRDVLPFTWENA
ncbi:MAG: EF-P lysine aminoacylase GenX [Parachlamydiales bacterium]|nr:EF-P lysine aminoacylase GenX [Candidatus Acheromyda pituitae]